MEVTTYVTIAVAITGWWLIVNNSQRIAERSEANTLVKSTVDNCQSLMEKVKKEWAGKTEISHETQMYFELLLADIEKKTILLGRYYFDPSVDVNLFIKVRQVTTFDASYYGEDVESAKAESRIYDASVALFRISSTVQDAGFKFANKRHSWVKVLFSKPRWSDWAGLAVGIAVLHGYVEVLEFIDVIVDNYF